MEILSAARAGNPFLHAQKGLFLYDAADSRIPLETRILGLDLARAEHLNQNDKDTLAKSERVRLLTLPSGEREALLALLERHLITRARLMPTLDNAVKELKKHW